MLARRLFAEAMLGPSSHLAMLGEEVLQIAFGDSSSESRDVKVVSRVLLVLTIWASSGRRSGPK